MSQSTTTLEQQQQHQRPAKGLPRSLPTSATFSFTAPFPPPSSTHAPPHSSAHVPPSSSSSSVSAPPTATTTTTTATTATMTATGGTGTVSRPSTTKQRRVSLALPSSPRQVQPWTFRDDTSVFESTSATGTKADAVAGREQRERAESLVMERKGKVRKLESGEGSKAADAERLTGGAVNVGTGVAGSGSGSVGTGAEKKMRKKWTMEETQMLVEGCNRHGVGNWKAILNDKSLEFDHRSPVDLKDRFRTYFPDAYKQHYPNAKTHLSTKIRSSLPDGTSIFEKTRSKKRRPFTPEEDRALKAGYERHGTVWAAIVKDPVFKGQGRRSTDLRDRFRNAFPDLYMK
ncbi:uncharacterized protein STEHIDRAFT_148425, partial [Stereum hirsutum FP-91666 SS1]|uniref:uncharacterized protein n=1 Tax=Stereum hirsutum (strain FP-91666) TaxID=721885 RepID=UPI00044499E6